MLDVAARAGPGHGVLAGGSAFDLGVVAMFLLRAAVECSEVKNNQKKIFVFVGMIHFKFRISRYVVVFASLCLAIVLAWTDVALAPSFVSTGCVHPRSGRAALGHK